MNIIEPIMFPATIHDLRMINKRKQLTAASLSWKNATPTVKDAYCQLAKRLNREYITN
ncbi:hypothetical protein Glove_187g113 [Diversispora epigaea]|uniref:Uncharacterized protein n=1 Tax=Diversispora epigaea TaxID=1348612 RepID=A0A397IPJ7_9GLOM|nr:hypothetical protein Glove_187g113 [Diversispora epigaea]